MCLGIPGRIIEVRGEKFKRMGKVDFGGVRKDISLAYVPKASVGDFVVVHVGFAISKIDEEQAKDFYAFLKGE